MRYQDDKYAFFHSYFNYNRQLVTMLLLLSIMLTFGVMFPPLAPPLLMAILSIYIVDRLLVSRYLNHVIIHHHINDNQQKQHLDHNNCHYNQYHHHHHHQDHDSIKAYLQIIDHECIGLTTKSIIIEAAWMIFTTSCWFYTPFLFDIIGDDVGFGRAYWVLIFMPSLPICLYIIYVGYKRYRSGIGDNDRRGSLNKSQCTDLTNLGKDDDLSGGGGMQREIELSVEFSQFHINVVHDNRNEGLHHNQHHHKNEDEEDV